MCCNIILLFRCTKTFEGSAECAMNASSYNILPPIISAKLTTKNHFLVHYGQLEVIAKLPEGDWIVSGKCKITTYLDEHNLISKLFLFLLKIMIILF